MDADALVVDYLERLRAASRSLPAARREELRGEVAEHIDAALAEAGRRDEVTVRNVLERLGPPEEIAAADAAGLDRETGARGLGDPSDRAASRIGGVEIVALLLLVFGGAAPVVGVLAGYVFTFASGRWSNRNRLIAGAIIALSAGIAFVSATVNQDPGRFSMGGVAAAMVNTAVGGMLAALYLVLVLPQPRRTA